ncbi:MAG: sensor histidine kinase [Spirochaetaceae bacterium]
MRRWSSQKQLSLRTTQLLLFVGIILTAIVLNMITLYHTQRYFSIFDRNLLGYYSIQRLHTALDTNRSALSQYLRRQESEPLRGYNASRAHINILRREVAERNYTTVETGFEIRAIRHGLAAYFDAAERAIGRRSGWETDYTAFVRAERISDYVYTYIQRLMRLRLDEELETHQQLRGHARILALSAQIGLLVVGILMSLFAAVFARRITVPIRRLAGAAHDMAHGKLDGEAVETAGRRFAVSEIATLCQSFNLMQRNIRTMVADLKDKAAVERQLHEQELKTLHTQHLLEAARLQGLQAQINPHFLFNSLNTISRVGMFEGAPDTTALIRSLAGLLRYHLSTPDALVALEHELRVVREYVYIQEYRFRDRLRFSLRCDVDVEKVQVPCFSIQPLVENAVQYGIEPLEEGGEVRVHIAEAREGVRIRVEDTGTGMPREEISRILKGNPVSPGIGISNVMGRLELLYHGKAGFFIERPPDGGTAVIMEIPNVEPDIPVRTDEAGGTGGVRSP